MTLASANVSGVRASTRSSSASSSATEHAGWSRMTDRLAATALWRRGLPRRAHECVRRGWPDAGDPGISGAAIRSVLPPSVLQTSGSARSWCSGSGGGQPRRALAGALGSPLPGRYRTAGTGSVYWPSGPPGFGCQPGTPAAGRAAGPAVTKAAAGSVRLSCARPGDGGLAAPARAAPLRPGLSRVAAAAGLRWPGRPGRRGMAQPYRQRPARRVSIGWGGDAADGSYGG
jgi:hypothetical protein